MSGYSLGSATEPYWVARRLNHLKDNNVRSHDKTEWLLKVKASKSTGNNLKKINNNNTWI